MELEGGPLAQRLRREPSFLRGGEPYKTFVLIKTVVNQVVGMSGESRLVEM
jgi:hypothetical protein